MLGTTPTMLGTNPTMLGTTPTMLGTTPTMLEDGTICVSARRCVIVLSLASRAWPCASAEACACLACGE